MLNFVRFVLVLIAMIQPLSAAAASLAPDTENVKVELIQEEETIQGGHPFWVALHLNLEKGWHVYWKNPGDAGMPLKVEWQLPPGYEAGPLQWPFPEKFTMADMVGFGYKDEVTLLAQITPPPTIEQGTKISLQAKMNWLLCSFETCKPGSIQLTLPLIAGQGHPRIRGDVASVFQQARSKIPQTYVQVRTIRNGDMVHLEVPHEKEGDNKETIAGAYFFPEDKDTIDHSIDATVALSPSDSNRYLVSLKEGDEIGAKSKLLKGVLVLHKQNDGQKSVEAIAIDSPIEEDHDNELSQLEPIATIGSLNKHSLKEAQPSASSAAGPSHTFEGGLGLALLFAFLGGMLLNLMPCVLPVVSFKVMSFVKMAGQSRSLSLKHGMMFSIGVILSFWILASAMLILRAYGQSVGWGFQLQEPLFVVILAALLFVFALSLFGLFEWGMFLSAWAGQTQADRAKQSSGFMGSFFSGVLATAVATPCTGPFLGSAVGFAVTLPVFQALLIFTVLGAGMCFPYLILAAFPAYLRFLPKPGAWMETFKQLMGFVLLATVLWLLWVFSAQTNTFSLICLLAGFLCFSIGCWIYGRGSSPLLSRKRRALAYAFVVLFVVAGCQVIAFPKNSWKTTEGGGSSLATSEWAGWQTFTPELVAQLRKEGKPVLIDFTAKWCLICQANHFVLSSPEMQKNLEEAGVVKLVADWTKSDPVITEALSQFGRNSVPLYVYYPPNGEPKILPQVLTMEAVLEHVSTEDIALR